MPGSLKRGDLVIAAERGVFSGKPRPWLVVQADEFLDMPSTVTVCLVTTEDAEAVFRIRVLPMPENGLLQTSTIFVDKVLTLRANAISQRIGVLSETEIALVDQALRRWLDL